jgi:hypothetical protein
MLLMRRRRRFEVVRLKTCDFSRPRGARRVLMGADDYLSGFAKIRYNLSSKFEIHFSTSSIAKVKRRDFHSGHAFHNVMLTRRSSGSDALVALRLALSLVMTPTSLVVLFCKLTKRAVAQATELGPSFLCDKVTPA